VSDVSAEKSLITVIPIPVGLASLREYVLGYVDIALRTDDVFCLDFLSGIVFSGDLERGGLPNLASLKLPDSWNTSWTHLIIASNGNSPLPGPYLLNGGRYWDVYRLYDDSINAFTTAFRPTNLQREKLTGLTIQSNYHTIRSIAVPSRLRRKMSPTLPLSGMRITVKDMFQIEGFRTSLGSRAYLALYPPAPQTAPAIQRLIECGAVVLGLTQLCSMVGTTEPTQYIDFQAPFNPRGDGYQSPPGGSSGQPAAIAAYEWLDIAIGSDCESKVPLSGYD
jgi:Amidase